MSTDGHRLWAVQSSPTQVWPLLVMAPNGSRLALETLSVSHPVDVFSPLSFDDVKGQLVEVYDAASAKLCAESCGQPCARRGRKCGHFTFRKPGGGARCRSDSGLRTALPSQCRSQTSNIQRLDRVLTGFQHLPPRVHWAAEVYLATAVIHYVAAAVTDRGRKRPSNEDAFGFSVEDGVYVVCDGMGGAAAGEIASSIAVDEVLRLLSGRNRDGHATFAGCRGKGYRAPPMKPSSPARSVTAGSAAWAPPLWRWWWKSATYGC